MYKPRKPRCDGSGVREELWLDGLPYYRYPDAPDTKSGRPRRNYFVNTSTKKRYHIELWKKYNREIPKGFEIHHVDGDSLNNELENLVCLSKGDHARITKFEQIGIQIECIVCNKKFRSKNTRKEWRPVRFCSGKCRQKKYNKEGIYKDSERTCPVCGTKTTKLRSNPALCCSQSCTVKLGHRNRKTSLQS
jgi:hypothetical protein